MTLALGATAVTFFALSAYVTTTKRDFGFMGTFLFAGMVIALLAGIGAYAFEIPALALAVSAIVVLLSAGLILFETSRIVSGGETNYVMATVGLYVSIFNLFSALLSLFGVGAAKTESDVRARLRGACRLRRPAPAARAESRQGTSGPACAGPVANLRARRSTA